MTPRLAGAEAHVDARKIWSDGLMTALVAALTAVAGVLLVRGVLGVAVFAPERDGAMGDASTGLLAGGAAVAALVATLLLHLLCLGTPQPGRFFAWIVTLATLVMVLLPFTTSVPLVTKAGTAPRGARRGAQPLTRRFMPRPQVGDRLAATVAEWNS
ncbi:DUF6069 family protein [Streptomyces sp. NPDC005349]|uniref:DUF6069 family protein n=1 Tax=Streptomyces sp. NPDC005349 TaxID=3157037 RepID=UPI0033AD16FD